MLELLRKIGLPATLASVIASLVVMLPLAFTVDERYAKHADLKATVEKLEKKNDDLRQELAQLVGYQQALLIIIQNGKIIQPTSFEEQLPLSAHMLKVQAAAPPASTASSAKPAPKPKPPLDKPTTLKELSEGLYRQQQRLMKDL